MKKRILLVFRVIGVLLLIMACVIALTSLRENRLLREVITANQKQLMLSPGDCQRLAVDLSTVDSPSLDYWKLVFQRGANSNVSHGQTSITFQERIDIYHSRYQKLEAPGRSNYFAELLLSLIQKQHDDGLQSRDLVSYLGTPDRTSNSVHGPVLLFLFFANGKQATGVFETSNGVVSTCYVDGEVP